ncbi:MAG: PhnD/SsuA/transferrin family substrate-binding protein [Spirochaetia bacterium]|jgi:ABC-type phosphate/phosphonate transport system substrate-binding protein|nr:PhnD/SsuA/transferrin family substrate-binding protein [Spirochaetia bacterium]
MLDLIPRSRIITLLCMFIILAVGISAVPVNIAVPASGEGMEKLLSWTPLIKYLEKETGLEINLNIVRDHRTIKEELEQKNYDFALIDPFWYENWKKTELCLPFLETIDNKATGIRSILIVHKSSIFRTLKDLENSNIALTVPYDSALGFYIPLALMFNQGIDPFSYFKAIVFPETFESILKGVAYGKLDSGFITTDLLDVMGNRRYRNDIRILLESEILPGPVIVVRNDFNVDLARIIRRAMILLTDKDEGARLLSGIGISGFKEIDEGIFEVLRNYIEVLDINNASPE